MLSVVRAEAAPDAWRAEVATRVDGLRDVLRLPDSGRVMVRAGTRVFRLSIVRDLALLSPLSADKAPVAPDDAIPQSRAAVRKGRIALAWLTEPTGRYGHGVLGDAIEAGALRVRLRDGRVLTRRLPEDSVFEDLQPRIVALDGAEAVLVVRSYLTRGAAIAAYRVAGDAIAEIAESRPIGMARRWLNPVGAADFDGDGRSEIAAVVTPHLSGRLTFYRRDGARFVKLAERAGYATHFIGSTVLEMSAILDVDDDGIADIVLPSLDRRTLKAVTFAGGAIRELRALRHESAIATAVVAADLDGNGRPEIIYGLEDGRLMVIRR